jgi:hypothetical protein
MKAFIVSGPPACGKTHFREKIAAFLGAEPGLEIDNHTLRSPFSPRAMALEPGKVYDTCLPLDQIHPNIGELAEVWDFYDLAQAAGFQPNSPLHDPVRAALNGIEAAEEELGRILRRVFRAGTKVTWKPEIIMDGGPDHHTGTVLAVTQNAVVVAPDWISASPSGTDAPRPQIIPAHRFTAGNGGGVI